MPNDNTNTQTVDPREATPNAGEATPEEAALIAAGTEVDDEGNPKDAAAEAAAAEAAKAEEAAKAAADAAAAEAAKAEEARAAEQARQAEQAAQQQPAAPVATLPPKPEPPKDFAAERNTLKKQYDDGDIDQDEYLEKRESLAIEEGAYNGRLGAWQENVEIQKAQAQAQFTATAVAWEQTHADFLANPLRAELMQRAIHAVDKETGGTLSPEALFAKAQKIAFEAANYQPPGTTGAPAGSAATPAKSVEELTKEALKERKPDTTTVPGTLRTAPQAAGLDPNSAAYDSLDRLDISSLEDTLARMTPEQQAKYLETAEGSNARGQAD